MPTALLSLALVIGEAHRGNAGELPVCSNRVINQVVKRVGCTLGDIQCWGRSGGFCGDYVEARIAAARPGVRLRLARVQPAQVQPGDVAVFTTRAHYALVEAVVRDGAGRFVAVDLSEFNYGSCWVDRGLLVTERYKLEGRREGVPVAEIDGGFLRALPADP